MKNRKWLLESSELVLQYFRWLCLLIFCILIYAKFIEPNWIEINSLQLTLPHLASEFNGYRIVQISDIHRDEWMTTRRLQHIVRLVNEQKPDLVAITGDLVTRNSPQLIPSLKLALEQLTPRDRTVAILGNHDHENDTQAIIKILKQSGVFDLNNTVYTLQRDNAILTIAGVDDVGMGKARLDLVLQQLPQQGAAILLAHEPDFANISAATQRFDLQLSGHSHGGQVRLPILKPLVLPPWGEKYYSGEYLIEKMLLYTNRGLGMTGLHLRLFSRPEITVLNLVTSNPNLQTR
ncbi:putative phosphohydrolase [Nostoc sp. PCC 7524]|uniref:metallophosphoesterase n=1 Tax=Nostoc sp. (strain ATCC 29411 / PCC 7524) TaxID=28072 RepID=UPI00029F2373|nr:metallophosphoesterase [Nostoc sp. PCC 7524]AFY49253.1 putative phosphohydrolase [Nostoc sp. PCC 7524]